MRLFVLCLLCLSVGTVWLVWVNPKPVDMAQFAPANSLVYVEANRPTEVLSALENTAAWKLLYLEAKGVSTRSSTGWVQNILRVTGLGPIDSVIMARSQLAIVVTDLGATEDGDTLKVKPEAAIIIETHTAERRIHEPIERALQRLVTGAYLAEPARHSIEGVRFVEWRNPDGDRQVIAAFSGSLVIVGNSRRVVDSCIDVVRRRAPSLREDPGLHRARISQDATAALTFGYVPERESARLISAGLPILLGRPLKDPQFHKLVTKAVSRFIGSLTWTSRAFDGGIEDKYQISLNPGIVKHLYAHFESPTAIHGKVPTSDFYSISQYRFEDPLATWKALRTTISAHTDALVAVVVNSTLTSSLANYGIEDPEHFLSGVSGPISTYRLDQLGERQLLIGRIRDRSKLTNLFERGMRFSKKSSTHGDIVVLENSDGSRSAALDEAFIVLGHPSDVQQYFRLSSDVSEISEQSDIRFANPSSKANVITYSNDSERVRTCFFALMRASKRERDSDLDRRVSTLPYAVTETTLNNEGMKRITRSPLGQFSAIIPLFIP